ncbi:MAG: TolC family protein [Deltaproteobacteria bacterium]|nr:TolC family protein [Deltaproteobacteria bacterium]MBW2650025.1 TolC family protein [Deltaproteobacteria bacterium]
MTKKKTTQNLVTAFITVVGCIVLASCISMDNGSVEDHIGPRTVSSFSTNTERELTPPGDHKATPTVKPEGPLTVTVQGAILMALENNRALKVEKLNPAILRTAEEEERSVFDPILTGGYSQFRKKSEKPSGSTGAGLNNEINANLGVSEYLPTGTDIGIDMSTDQSWSNLYSDDLYASRVGLSITQALLRGAGLNYNLARLRQARLGTRVSAYELRGFAEALVAQVEETYWDYALTQRQIKIFLDSLKLAEQQKNETEEMIRIGVLAESELAAAEAEIALRREGLINARSNLEKTSLQILRLLNPPDTNLWQREVILLHEPKVPNVKLDDIESHVGVALRMRQDLNQARLQIQMGDLEIVKTKNGLLPKMDFFINLGKTGYAGSFGSSARDIDGNTYDILAGVSLEYPFINRKARARHRNSLLSRKQAEEAMKNLVQLVQVDVRSAYIEANRAKEQIAATAATRTFQKEKARIETEKFRVGKSTTLLVAQAQRDLLSSRITETQAIANYLKSLIELYRLEGSLLERRGIMAPGREPVLDNAGI